MAASRVLSGNSIYRLKEIMGHSSRQGLEDRGEHRLRALCAGWPSPAATSVLVFKKGTFLGSWVGLRRSRMSPSPLSARTGFGVIP